jgi:hypothetical protein
MTTPPEEVVAQHRKERHRTGLLLIAVALVLALCLGFVYRSDHQVQVTSQRSDTLEKQVIANGQIAQEAKEGVEEANRRLRAAGKPTVPVPTVSPISPPPSTAEVESLTVEQVRAVVVTELAQHKASLSQAEINQVARVAAALVPKPADGKTPTKAELQPMVAAALAAYCVDDKCVGKPGETGPRGGPGERGPQGPQVTDEQLLAAAQAALQTYCAAESQPCKGPQGEPGASVTGPPGGPGPAGRGIADTDCQEDGTWLITYTDGTKDTARGPCRVVIPPTQAKAGN